MSTVVASLLMLAGVVGLAVYVDEQKRVREEQSGSYAGQRARSADAAVIVAQSQHARGEETSGGQPAEKEADGRPFERTAGGIRPVERADLRLTAWSAWIGIFVGLIASLITLPQLTGPGRRGSGVAVGRRCVVCVASARDSGELAISLVNVGIGAVMLAYVTIRYETGRDLIGLPGLVVDVQATVELVVFPPLVVRPDRLDVANTLDGGGYLEVTLRKDVATKSYVLVRQAEVH